MKRIAKYISLGGVGALALLAIAEIWFDLGIANFGGKIFMTFGVWAVATHIIFGNDDSDDSSSTPKSD